MIAVNVRSAAVFEAAMCWSCESCCECRMLLLKMLFLYVLLLWAL